MRALILRGGPWTEDERTAILDYCEADVEALERLLPAMLPKHRSAPSAAAGPLHGRRGGNGARRDADRRRHARAVPAPLDGHPRPTHRRDRRQPMACLKAAPSRPNGLPVGWPPTTSLGRCSKAAISISATIRSANRPAPTRRCRHCASCDRRCRTCGSTIWRSARTDEIAQYCQRLDRAPAAINHQILSLYLARACGCAA